MLKLNIARETAETNPFVEIWASDRPRPAEDEGRSPSPTGTVRNAFMLVLSCVTCFLGLMLAGYGLYQITRPAISLPVGISYAGLGGTVVVGSCVVIHRACARMAALVQRARRVASATAIRNAE